MDKNKDYMDPKLREAIDNIKVDDSKFSVSWDGGRVYLQLYLHIGVWVTFVVGIGTFYIWSLKNSQIILGLLGYK